MSPFDDIRSIHSEATSIWAEFREGYTLYHVVGPTKAQYRHYEGSRTYTHVSSGQVLHVGLCRLGV